MNKGMCNTTKAKTVKAIALAIATCYTCGIFRLQLDRVNRLSGANTTQPDQSSKKDSTERGCHLMQTMHSMTAAFSFPTMAITQVNQPKARDCDVVAIRIAPALMPAIRAAAKADGYVSKGGRPLPGKWLEAKTAKLLRQAVKSLPG
jgi:hypothetical protein